MTDQTQYNGRTKSASTTQRLSPDGQWRSFKFPNLLQYVKTGTYYGRVKVNGKITRRTLHRDGEAEISFTTAKLRLGDFIKKHRTAKQISGTFADARARYEARLGVSGAVNELSRVYRHYCIKKLLKSWPGLDQTRLEKITPMGCEEWAARLRAQIHGTYFNNTLGTLRLILKEGGLPDDPTAAIARVGAINADLKLPSPDDFEKILTTMETAGGGESRNCADYVRFLAFSGCRISEAAQVTWANVDFDRGTITVQNAKRRMSQNNVATRTVPMISDMRALLTRLQTERKPKPEQKVCLVYKCIASLTSACKKVKVQRITHHDLRHLFATKCIESGVDIPTVAAWLGHRDGGALAMKVYHHFQQQHSTAMAAKVSFSGGVK